MLRSMNYSKFDEEKGSNYETNCGRNSAVSEQELDNTLLTFADTYENVN